MAGIGVPTQTEGQWWGGGARLLTGRKQSGYRVGVKSGGLQQALGSRLLKAPALTGG